MSNADQRAFWSAQTTWIQHQAAMDTCIEPVLDLVLEHADLQPGQSVLDIGCGTGASVLAAAQRVGDQGHVLGIDIAEPLLDVAKQRCADLPNVTLLTADAQSDALPRQCDAAMSRFGVMFFEDTVRAFSNIAKGLTPGARITCAAWAAAKDNPFFVFAAQAARDVFGPMPKTDRTLPGPFAFEDAGRVTDMLRASGLQHVQITTQDMFLHPEPDLSAFAELCMAIGPAASAIKYFEADAAQKAALHTALQEIFHPFQKDTTLRIPASIHVIQANTAVT